MGEFVGDSGYDDVIVTSQRPSDVFHFLLSTGVFSELKIVTYYFFENCGPIRIAQFSYWWESKAL